MTLVWLIAWLTAAWSGGHAPVGDVSTGTLIIAFAIDVGVQHALEIGKLPTEETVNRSRRVRIR